MGNDIISIFMDRKKEFIIQSTALFIRYLIDEKAKMTKTIEKMTSIYYRDFYWQEEVSFEELNAYFSLPNLKDELLKKSLLSCVRCYKESCLESKVEEDIKTVVLLSTSFYLAVSSSNLLDTSYEKELKETLAFFLDKYQGKMRFCTDKKQRELSLELLNLWKKEAGIYTKFFKKLEESAFDISLEPLLDFNNGYLVKGTYDIKMLYRYAEVEVEDVYQEKGFYLDHLLISLEKLSLLFLKEKLTTQNGRTYFLKVPAQLFEKEKYREMISKIAGYPPFQKSFVFLFSYTDSLHHTKILEELKKEGYLLGIQNVKQLEKNEKIFENVQFLFISPSVLDTQNQNISFLEDKNIRFILWEEEKR